MSSHYLGGDSGEIPTQRDWMACAQNDRLPQEFHREWATPLRRLPGMNTEWLTTRNDSILPPTMMPSKDSPGLASLPSRIFGGPDCHTWDVRRSLLHDSRDLCLPEKPCPRNAIGISSKPFTCHRAITCWSFHASRML